MEDIINSTLLTFDAPKNSSSFIKVIGVGGGGGNAVKHMMRQGIKDVDFIVCNTDRQALDDNPVPTKILLGSGLGAGNRPDVAKRAAEEKKDEIKEILARNTKMLFITAGLGGGTGTGAAPVIARIAKEIKLDDEEIGQILVVAIVTMPFRFEGKPRERQAQKGLEELREIVDATLVISNDKMRMFGNLPMPEALDKANDVLQTAAKSIAEIITVTSFINTDFRDVNTVLAKSGSAYMGTGTGKGEERAKEAIEAASKSQLLDDTNIAGAQNVLLYFSYPPDKMITMDELDTATSYMTECINDPEANVIWGAGADECLTEELKVTIIATGFQPEKKEAPVKIDLDADKPEPADANKVQSQPAAPVETPVAEQKTEAAKPVAQTNDTAATASAVVTAGMAEQKTETEATVTRHVYTLDPVEAPAMESVAEQPARVLEPAIEAVEPTAESVTAQPIAESIPDDGIVLTRVQRTETVETPAAELRTETVETPVAEQRPAFTPEPAPVANFTSEPAAAVKTAPAPRFPQPESDDSRSKQLAERIRRMNELLHSNPDGPAIVERMNPMENAGGLPIAETYNGNLSRHSELASTVASAGVIMQPNDCLHGLPD